MDLKNYQIFLAKLYTDPFFRERFWDDPVRVGEEHGIDKTTAEKIRQVPHLQFFSESLINKRLQIVRRLMPLSHEVLGESYNSLFREFAPTFQNHESRPYEVDSIAFADFIFRKHQKQPFLSLLQTEILHFERQIRLINLSHKRYFIFFKFFSYPVHRFHFAKSAIQPRKTLWFFVRIGKIQFDRLWS